MLTRSKFFELLYTIASTANNQISLEDFLSSAIGQIASSFKSEIGIFYLIEENSNIPDKKGKLVAYYGISMNFLESINSIPVSEKFFNSIITSQEPISIHDLNRNQAIINSIRESGGKSLIATTLLFDQRIEGVIVLAQKKDVNYDSKEIAQIKSTMDEVAKLINGKRRNHLSIALSERQRLLRDLHDSVSQKLYGLVALTEAAYAAVEAGSKINLSQTFLRIGENARQAVKEMRLFIYEMQPVDLKDGLVNSLQHRLAAVEGRANIKARFIADENVDLSSHQQVGIYYIAQEALNNVLRHAHANTVTVRLKKNNSKIILEIEDDGIGFTVNSTVDSVEPGLGLRSMRERASQMGGKLDVFSRQGKGTTVKLTLDRIH